MNIVTTVIKSRHSVRKFKPDPVGDLVIADALECAATCTDRHEYPALAFRGYQG